MKYINRRLTIEKISLQKIANKFGTPFYSYSYSKLKENINNFKKNFRSFSPLICFAVKSNTNVNICLLYTSPSPRDAHESRMPSSA